MRFGKASRKRVTRAGSWLVVAGTALLLLVSSGSGCGDDDPAVTTFHGNVVEVSGASPTSAGGPRGLRGLFALWPGSAVAQSCPAERVLACATSEAGAARTVCARVDPDTCGFVLAIGGPGGFVIFFVDDADADGSVDEEETLAFLEEPPEFCVRGTIALLDVDIEFENEVARPHAIVPDCPSPTPAEATPAPTATRRPGRRDPTPTPMTAATPTPTSGAIPTATPGVTPTATPGVTPTATPDATPTMTPSPTPTHEPGTASVGDFVWDDLDGDGIQEVDEPGLENVVVNLYDSADDQNPVATTTTDADGAYLFVNQDPGDYFVEFEAPAGYVFSPADQGVDDEVDSDANETTGRTEAFAVGADEEDLTRDAGLHLESTPTPTPTADGTPTPTATPEGTATPTPTPDGTATPTPTATPEETATPTPTPTATPEETATPTPTPTATPEETATPTPTATPEETATPTPTATPGGCDVQEDCAPDEFCEDDSFCTVPQRNPGTCYPKGDLGACCTQNHECASNLCSDTPPLVGTCLPSG